MIKDDIKDKAEENNQIRRREANRAPAQREE
jgi:hypothetical protein